jgi:hypothetical protein
MPERSFPNPKTQLSICKSTYLLAHIVVVELLCEAAALLAVEIWVIAIDRRAAITTTDVDQLVVSVGWPTNSSWALDGQTTRRSKTLAPVGNVHVRWVLAEGWQRYWADGAADEAMVWSTADGAMGGCFVMVEASNFACKWVGILRYLFCSISATYSYRRNFDANHEIASFQLTTITKLLRCYFPDWITHSIVVPPPARAIEVLVAPNVFYNSVKFVC